VVTGRVEGQFHLLIDVEPPDPHRVNVGIPTVQIVRDAMRLQVLRVQQFHRRAGHDVRRRGMAARDGRGPDMRGQEPIGQTSSAYPNARGF
jgi:hypothetical protein